MSFKSNQNENFTILYNQLNDCTYIKSPFLSDSQNNQRKENFAQNVARTKKVPYICIGFVRPDFTKVKKAILDALRRMFQKQSLSFYFYIRPILRCIFNLIYTFNESD